MISKLLAATFTSCNDIIRCWQVIIISYRKINRSRRLLHGFMVLIRTKNLNYLHSRFGIGPSIVNDLHAELIIFLLGPS